MGQRDSGDHMSDGIGWWDGYQVEGDFIDGLGAGGLGPDYPGPAADDFDDRLMLGSPETEAPFWHQQELDDSCAVVAQEEILREFGQPVTELGLAAEADSHGWYSPGQGTGLSEVGNLLEAHGVPTERTSGASLADLVALSGQDVPVIVAVDSAELWAGADEAAGLVDPMSVVGADGSDHAVVITGFDLTDPGSPEVIVNDSGRPDGAALHVPVDSFERAWAASDNFMVHPDVDGPQTPVPAAAGASPDRLGTSWTVDGESEAGNPVEWSTSYNAYFDEKTGEQVEPK